MNTAEITAVSASTSTHTNGHRPATRKTASPKNWRSKLLTTKDDKVLENVSNLLLVLKHHPQYQGRLTWDSIRGQVLYDATPLTEKHVTDIAEWLGTAMTMPLRSFTLLERCLCAVAKERPRDLLQEWLEQLPAWDGTSRLETWLHVVASVEMTPLNKAISRLLPVSMVARALNPGCQYRIVVILEGPEDSGKSKLVWALASPEWYVELSMGLESKEAHMMLQGAWVAELPELDSLSRTEEARLKAFLTLREDTWIPKYSNFKTRSPRRTIFIGTVNPDAQGYLKGQTGNTRFLPIKTGAIAVERLLERREQLFAEALVYYTDHPEDWWRLPEETQAEAVAAREARRIVNAYEGELSYWLYNGRGEGANGMPTTWREIAQEFLQIERPEGWKDRSLQMQIAQALRALGWERSSFRQGKSVTTSWKAPNPCDSPAESM